MTERIIWVGRSGRVLRNRRGAVGGEVIVTTPDGRVEHTIFRII
jgi:hypothetical protein